MAPLPDEPEVDEDLDQDEALEAVPDATESTNLATAQDDLSKPPSPKPQLSMTLLDPAGLSVDPSVDVLDASLKPLDGSVDVGMDLETVHVGDGMELDMSGLGPDSLNLEQSPVLSGPDALVGGQEMRLEF